MDMHSGIVLSQTDGRPMYLQIMEQVKERVAVGDWEPGQGIPSIRGLAIALRVSVITVKRAYLELEREGVIVTRQGKGSSIALRPDLGADLRQEELESHLLRAAQLAAGLGLSLEQLTTRLRRAHKQSKKDTT